MGGKSQSSSANSTTTTTINDVDSTNVSIQGEGHITGNGNRVINMNSDSETLQAFSRDAFGSMSGISENALGAAADLGYGAFDSANSMFSSAASAMGDVASGANSVAKNAVNEMGSLAQNAVSGANSVAGQAFDLTGGMHGQNIGFMTDLSSGLLQLAADSSKGSMALVNNYTERAQLGQAGAENNAMKMVAIAAVGVAGLVILRGK